MVQYISFIYGSQLDAGARPAPVPKYAHERWPLLNQTRGRPPKFTVLLSNPKYLKPLANYLDATGKFELEPANPPSE